MKKKLISSFVLIFACMLTVLAAPLSLNSGDKKVLVTITVGKKTENITQGDLNAKIAEVKASGEETSEDEILEILINDKVFLMSAGNDNVSVSDKEVNDRLNSLKQELEKQYNTSISDELFYEQLQKQLGSSMSLLDYKKALKESLLVDKYVRLKKGDKLETTTLVSDDEVKSFYRKNESSFINPEYVRVSHVYSPKTEANAKENMEEALRKIKAHEISFEKAVMEYSKDEESKTIGGDIGNVTNSNADVLGDDFIDTMLDLDVGEIADKVVESPSGYHIIKAVYHAAKRFLTLDDYISPDSSTTVREYIRAYLQNQKAQENYVNVTNELVEELKKSARIIYAK